MGAVGLLLSAHYLTLEKTNFMLGSDLRNLKQIKENKGPRIHSVA
jgi:hypothetical protein